jgi:hypothetical protein
MNERPDSAGELPSESTPDLADFSEFAELDPEELEKIEERGPERLGPPPEFKLDADAPEGLDSAVDDAGPGGVVLDRPVGANRPPRPLGPGQWTGPREPATDKPATAEPATPEPSIPTPPAPTGSANPGGKRETQWDPRVEIDLSEQEETDSAVDDSEPTGRPGRGLEVPPSAPPPPRPAPTAAPIDSAVDDSDPVYIMAGPKPAVVGDDPPLPRSRRGPSRVIAGGAVLAAAAIVAAAALLPGGGGEGEDAAVDPTSTVTVATTEAAATEAPAFTTVEVPSLFICGDGSSFSGFEQADGTILDAETGEPRACPTSGN